MSVTKENPAGTVQRFELRPNAVYTLETAAHLADVPRRLILIYYMHGLVSPVADLADAGYYFNDEAIRALRRIEFLRVECGFNLKGTQIVLDLMKEVERLRAELRFARG
jgi:DNA-binding transcriptional MerR regulator